ncbi:hypothetical protein Fuma_02826 [Fuerstiella marisgermanici]|uniref:Uncharacterized protein n=2 Tax=Fuerstiella marisgermanici TaxID=1891926 RepID=A0A1P8WGL2_9PLAN|nr:hypothetical protein Fuma_02826 [Fuerstiella marisgermanici]
MGILPARLPENVVIVLSGQSVEVLGATLRERVSSGDAVQLPKLELEVCLSYCSEVLPEALASNYVFIHSLCVKANGHPLYLNYLIQFAKANPSAEDLDQFPTFVDSIETYYEQLWTRILDDPHSVNLLAMIARLREPIDRSELVGVLNQQERTAFTSSIAGIKHLLVQSDQVEVYHDSFREFVASKTEELGEVTHSRFAAYGLSGDTATYGKVNSVYHHVRGNYAQRQSIASICTQNWADVCVKCGVSPDNVLADVADAVDTATSIGDPVAVNRLLLLSQRLSFRYDHLLAQSAGLLADALIGLGRPAEAILNATRYGSLIVHPHDALPITYALIRNGCHDEAVSLLESVDHFLSLRLDTSEIDVDQFLNIWVNKARCVVLAELAGVTGCGQKMWAMQRYVMKAIDRSIRDIDPTAARANQLLFHSMTMSDFFSLSGRYIDNETMRRTLGQQSVTVEDDDLLYIRVVTVLNYCHFRETFRVPVRPQLMPQLIDDIRELIWFGSDVDEKLLLVFLDCLIRLGCESTLVFLAAGDSLPGKPSKVGLVLKNGVDADLDVFDQWEREWRVFGFASTSAKQPETSPFNATAWLQSIAEATAAIAFLEGRMRRALSDEDEFVRRSTSEAMANLVRKTINFTLKERVEWEHSYLLPESLIPQLFRTLSNAVCSCFPEHKAELINLLTARCDDQFGLYTEGFRTACRFVTDVYTRHDEGDTRADRAACFSLLETWRDHTIRFVENRHELTPELLMLVDGFSRIGAVEEAGRIYDTLLSRSMGPTWYKEDQFGLMISALKAIPADEPVSDALPRIAGYLEAASGEMTFQRFVRYDKANFIGELIRRKQFGAGLNYFVQQSTGKWEQLSSRWGRQTVDMPAPHIGNRYLVDRIDEQASILKIVRAAEATDWRLRWGLLELFLLGDFRHVGDFATEFAAIVNEAAGTNSMDEFANRIALAVESDVPDEELDTFIGSFRSTLDETHRKHFWPETEASDPTADSAATTEPNVADEDQKQRLDDEMFSPGIFGRRDAIANAKSVVKSAIAERNLGNAKQARIHLSTALQLLQEGGWPLWNNDLKIADTILAALSNSSSGPDQLLASLGPAIAKERYSPQWKVAERLIEILADHLTPQQRQDILTDVLRHVELMVGTAAEEISEFDDLGSDERGRNEELFAFLLNFLEHPLWIRREKAAEVVMWVVRHSTDCFAQAARIGFSMEVGNGPDVCCGIVDVLSADNPAGTWQKLQAALDLAATCESLNHISRLVILERVASRVGDAGTASGSDIASRVGDKFRSGAIALATSKHAQLPNWTRCLSEQLNGLREYNLITPEYIRNMAQNLERQCHPLPVVGAFELQRHVLDTFRAPPNWPLNSWEARVRFAINCELLPYASKKNYRDIERLFRVYSPSIPFEFRQCRSALQFQDIRESILSEADYTAAIGDDEYFLLQFSELSAEDGTLLEIDAVVVSGNCESPPELDTVIDITDFPNPDVVRAPHETCIQFNPDFSFLGSYCPAVPLAGFLKASGATEVDILRVSWRAKRNSEHLNFGKPSAQGACLAVRKSAVKLRENQNLAWIISANHDLVAMVNQDDSKII